MNKWRRFNQYKQESVGLSEEYYIQYSKLGGY